MRVPSLVIKITGIYFVNGLQVRIIASMWAGLACLLFQRSSQQLFVLSLPSWQHHPSTLTVFVNQSLVLYSMATTSSPAPWYPARTQLGCICTQCGKPLRWTNGFITAALTSWSCFTSSLASSAIWVGNGNSAIDWE